MSKCFDEIDYLYYIDNEMEAKEILRIELHLKECEKCRKYIDDEINNNTQISESFISEVPSDDLITKLNKKTSLNNRRINIKKLLTWGLTAAAILFIVLINFISTSDSKKHLSEIILKKEKQILISQVSIEGHHAKVYQFTSNNRDKKYFWLKKKEN